MTTTATEAAQTEAAQTEAAQTEAAQTEAAQTEAARSRRAAAPPQTGLAETLGDIDGLVALTGDWDGEGAAQIAPAAVSCAKALATALDQAAGAGSPWPQPDVAPNAKGGVGLSWQRGGRLIWLIVSPSGQEITCVVREKDGEATQRTVSPGEAVPVAASALGRS